MKIVIKDGKTKELDIPNFTLLNKTVIKKILREANVEVDYELISVLLKAIKTSIKEFGHFTVLEVIDSDGNGIKIDI